VVDRLALSSEGDRVVFRATKAEEQDVVIKVVLADSKFAVEQLRNEQSILEKLHSAQPGWSKHMVMLLSSSNISLIGDYLGRPIPQLVSSSHSESTMALVTRPVGRSLIHFLDFNHANYPPSSEARHIFLSDWMMQLCEAVLFLHSHGVIHRDIKPSNMILVGSCIQLIDLGLAWSTDQKVPEPAGTSDFASLNVLMEGTPVFQDDWISLILSLYALYVGMARYKLEVQPPLDHLLTMFPHFRLFITD